ncbi:MAG TPA: phasin family protein [Crenalkalicoccus sp.]|jgi:phasin family protein|nr:phasin family protein [Crenalkalicoccus sp.]
MAVGEPKIPVGETKIPVGETKEPKVAEVKKLVNEQVNAGATQARRLVEEQTAQTRAAMEKTMDQANKAAESVFKAAEEAAEFGRGNLEAMTRATQAYVAGVQDLGRQTLAMVQGLTDHALQNARALAGVKSLKEATEIQANFTRTAFERTLSESAKLQETALKVAEQSFAPLSARVHVAMEKMARPVAA